MRLSAFLVLICLCFTDAYKILMLSPLPAKSHAILAEAMVNHLAKAGHEVTYIASIIPDTPVPGVKIVDVSNNIQIFGKVSDGPLNLKKILDKVEVNNNLGRSLQMLSNLSNMTLSNPNVQKLMSDQTQHFDVIIVEWMFVEIYAGLSSIFNCPYIWLSTVQPHWMILKLIDGYPSPAYNVDIMSNRVPPLTFLQRVKELCLQVKGSLLKLYYTSAAERKLYEKLIAPHIRSRGREAPSFDIIKYNASLVLSNSHVSLGLPMRLPPNLIHIGGYHIEPKVKPLPQNLQTIMDNAKHGFIYFSMGSNLRSKHFPDEIKQSLLKTFGELKQIVFWKFEEDLPNRPSNVHILQWAPQQSILAHKNCKIFITHGGLLSTTETINFGVPIIGIPVFGDQHLNVERSVKKGFAKKVDLSYEMASNLKEAITDILSDPKYTTKAKELSFIYHDRPSSPAKDLVHWVEHVVKTKGAPHLRSLAFLLPWYQKIYLDLMLVLIVMLIAVYYMLKSLTTEDILKKASSMVSACEDYLGKSLGDELVQFAELLKTDMAIVLTARNKSL